jgi:hypothetical protein
MYPPQLIENMSNMLLQLENLINSMHELQDINNLRLNLQHLITSIGVDVAHLPPLLSLYHDFNALNVYLIEVTPERVDAINAFASQYKIKRSG